MTKKERVEKNISITFDFLRYLIEHPEMVKEIPDNAELHFIDKELPMEDQRVEDKLTALFRVGHVFEPV